MEIGYKIKKIRELRNYSQEHMAEKLGISQVSYSRVEKGQTKLDFKRLQDILLLLEIDLLSLLNFDDSFILNNCEQSGNTAYNHNPLTEQDRKLFEDRIVNLENKLAQLLSTIAPPLN